MGLQVGLQVELQPEVEQWSTWSNNELRVERQVEQRWIQVELQDLWSSSEEQRRNSAGRLEADVDRSSVQGLAESKQ